MLVAALAVGISHVIAAQKSVMEMHFGFAMVVVVVDRDVTSIIGYEIGYVANAVGNVVND